MYITFEWEQRKNGLYRKSRLSPKQGQTMRRCRKMHDAGLVGEIK